ncbi:PspC domain-containing protein [Vagococcus silagei]|uniref:PspC domain-containing protein n=2 Tax=Vagococcus silagei TaxID=2508885 RepID=A0A4S3B0R2_9ENTE|nr:PspC domain-containing protein [Vagococcus silagei]
MITGVYGGLDKFGEISSNIFRILFFLPGALLIYITLAIMLPKYLKLT